MFCQNNNFHSRVPFHFAGGVLFKTYVVGDYVRVVRRFSLPDVPEGEMKRNGIMPFPRVSCAAESAEEALAAGILDPQAAGRFHFSSVSIICLCLKSLLC